MLSRSTFDNNLQVNRLGIAVAPTATNYLLVRDTVTGGSVNGLIQNDATTSLAFGIHQIKSDGIPIRLKAFGPNYTNPIVANHGVLDSTSGLGLIVQNAAGDLFLAVGGFSAVHKLMIGTTAGIQFLAGKTLSALGGLTVEGAIEADTSYKMGGTTVIFANRNIKGNNVTADGFLNVGTSTELTIVAGVITATKTHHTVDTEADASSDNLDTINGGSEGDILILRANNSARTVVLMDNTGNLRLAGDFSLTHNLDTITLLFRSAEWVELSRSDNAA